MTGPRLGEILCDLKAATAGQVREGLENQVIFGGRLGTNLLELGSVREEDLARALGQRYGRPCLFGDLKVDPAAAKLFGAEQAERYEAIPYLLTDRKLALLVCNPENLQALDEVSFVTGKEVRPIVVPEARLWALMRRLYGLDRHLRGIEMEGTLRAPPPAAQKQKPPPGPDLMDETEFQALYHGGIHEPSTEHAVPRDPFEDIVVHVEAPGAVEPGQARAAREAPPPAAEASEPSPLNFAEAVRFLDGVTDRSAIAHTVLRYARSRFKRAVLLTVHRGVAAGWEGLGEGLDRQGVLRTRVKLGQPGALETVVATRAHFLGPLQKTDQNLRLLKALGGGVPRNAFLVPILVLGRVVNVLYADNGRGGAVDDGELGELLILATQIANSYNLLIERSRNAAPPADPALPGGR